MTDDTVNVEKIMEEIRREIKEKGLSNDLLSFEDIPVPDKISTLTDAIGVFDRQNFLNSNKVLNNSYRVSLWQPLYGNRLKLFIKKILRQLIRPITQPVIEEQTAFNSAVMRNLNEIRNYILNDDDGVRSGDQRYIELLKRLEKLEKENSELKQLISKFMKQLP
jgi:hypothetical protein